MRLVSSLQSLQIWARRRRISLGILIILVYFFPTFTYAARAPGGSSQHAGVDRECNGIGNLIKSKGFSYPWWNTGFHGAIVFNSDGNSSVGACPVGKTGNKSTKCCREFDTVIQRNEMSSAFSDKWLGPKFEGVAEIYKERKTKFDAIFKELLKRAHSDFHAMFERTYGMLYIQHAPIFHALFTTLEAYYDTGRDSLEAKLNEFFAILTRKMFEVLNAQYEFDDSYLSCATIVIIEKQGGDLHRQIVSSLRRSFVATRALAQGLNDADRVYTNLKKLKMDKECISSLSEMLQCPICSEQRAYKPCMPLCVGVTSKCLSATVPMNKAWVDFTASVEAILERLLGPYNVEAVVEPIHIKISEAIMNFQESGPELSQAVFTKCGKPKLKSARNYRRRRESPPENLRERTGENSGKRGPNQQSRGNFQTDGFRSGSVPDDTQPSKSLEKLLKEIKTRVKKSKSVWDLLPRQVCNAISKDYSTQLCWNGSAPMKPDRNKTSEEVETKIQAEKGIPNLLVAEQVIILQGITEKLRASFNGFDVLWVKESEELDFGGSGMGSGSGEIPTDLDDSDDDDPAGQIHIDRNHPSTNIPEYTRPNFPAKPPPAILNPLPPHHDDDDDEDSDEDYNGSDNNVSWNTGNPNNKNRDHVENESFDFLPSPPKVNKPPPPPIFVPETTTTTKRPEIEVSKTIPTTSSGSIDDTGKAVAFFKLFSPILASLIGKAFSFT